MASSRSLLGRLNCSAVRALPSDTVMAEIWALSSLVEHQQVAAAVENGDGDLPGIFRRLQLRRCHDPFGLFERDRRAVGRRHRRFDVLGQSRSGRERECAGESEHSEHLGGLLYGALAAHAGRISGKAGGWKPPVRMSEAKIGLMPDTLSLLAET